MTIEKTIGALTLALLVSAGVASAQTVDPSAATTVNTTHAAITSVNVGIQGNVFNPHNIVVSPGTTIRWTNLDSAGHSIVADNGSFGSGMIPAGGTYSRVFSDPGTYLYYDPAYGSEGGKGMFGVIVVLPAGQSMEAGMTSNTSTASNSNLPGLPNTGAGGDAAKNVLMLALSAAIIAVGTRAFLRAM